MAQNFPLPPGWVASRRGGWHNSDLCGFTGIVKPHARGRSWGWAVFGPGRSLLAGWGTAYSPLAAMQACTSAAAAAYRQRLTAYLDSCREEWANEN